MGIHHPRQSHLAAGKIVLSDRYADATAAYQGGGRGFSRELIDKVINIATEGLKPNLTLLFDLSIDESMARLGRRSSVERDRLDAETTEFHARVRDAYLRIAAGEPKRVKLISARGTINETQAQVLDIVVPFLKKLAVN